MCYELLIYVLLYYKYEIDCFILNVLQGRGVGVTIGCLLGMLPLLFMNKESENKESSEKAKKT